MNDSIHIVHLDKNVSDEWITQLAAIHRDEIKAGFLSSLGIPFLRKLYRTLAGSEHAFVIAAMNGDEVVGFICGGLNTRKIYRDFLIRCGFTALPILLPKLLTFSRIRKVFETLFYPSRKENQNFPEEEILNFCVAASWQRHGVGKRLFFALMDEFRRRGVKTVKIVTGESQKSAQAFYDGLKIPRAGEIVIHGGSSSIVYVYQVEKEC